MTVMRLISGISVVLSLILGSIVLALLIGVLHAVVEGLVSGTSAVIGIDREPKAGSMMVVRAASAVIALICLMNGNALGLLSVGVCHGIVEWFVAVARANHRRHRKERAEREERRERALHDFFSEGQNLAEEVALIALRDYREALTARSNEIFFRDAYGIVSSDAGKAWVAEIIHVVGKKIWQIVDKDSYLDRLANVLALGGHLEPVHNEAYSQMIAVVSVKVLSVINPDLSQELT